MRVGETEKEKGRGRSSEEGGKINKVQWILLPHTTLYMQ